MGSQHPAIAGALTLFLMEYFHSNSGTDFAPTQLGLQSLFSNADRGYDHMDFKPIPDGKRF